MYSLNGIYIVACLFISTIVESNAYHIELNVPNAQVYHDQENDPSKFKYGYQVENINNQFQHKQEGADDVTYGCYGHIDPVGGKQLTFFVADRLGYRTVLINQDVTVYPLTAETVEGSGVSGGNLIQWKNLPFPTACLSSEVSATSSSAQSGLALQRYDETDTAESRDAFQRTLLAETQNPLDDLVYPPPSSDSQQAAASDYQTITDLGPQESWQLSSNNNGTISVDASDAANQPRPSDKGHEAEGQSSVSVSGEPLVGGSNSLPLRSQCEPTGTPNHQIVTLFVPFRVSCTDMKEFEAELAKLMAKFEPPRC